MLQYGSIIIVVVEVIDNHNSGELVGMPKVAHIRNFIVVSHKLFNLVVVVRIVDLALNCTSIMDLDCTSFFLFLFNNYKLIKSY